MGLKEKQTGSCAMVKGRSEEASTVKNGLI